MEIVLIGTGNTATVLGKKCKAAGHTIVQVLGRNKIAAERLATALDSNSSTDWNGIKNNADLYLIAVADGAIEEVVKKLSVTDKTVVHTAGAISKEVLKDAKHYGVFYPLQSLTKETVLLPDIPVI